MRVCECVESSFDISIIRLPFQKMEKGYANFLYKCSVDDVDSDSVVIRVFGAYIPYSERLAYRMRKLHEAGIIPKVYCG